MRKIAKFTALAIAAVVLTSCAASQPSTPTATLSNDPITLRYAYWGPNQTAAMQKIADAFHAKYPNVTVNLELTPFKQYFTKLQNSAQGEDLADVFWINATNFQLYAANGQLADQGDVPRAVGVSASDYPPAAVDLYRYNGTQYAFPKDFDTVGLWYNRALFDKAGVTYPTKDWTWNDVIAAAQKLTTPDVYGIGVKLDPQAWIYNVVPQGGGTVISADQKKSGYGSDGSLKGLEYMSDLVNKYKVSPSLAQTTETDTRQMFGSGKLAMIYDGSYAAVELHKNEYTRGNVDVVQLPAGPAGDKTVIHGVGQAISAKSKNIEWAKKYVQFLVGPEGARIQGETGTTLPSYKAGQELWLKAMPQFHLQAFLDEVVDAYPYPTSKNAPVWQAYETEEMRRLLTGAATPSDVGAELAKKMDSALAVEGK